MNIEAILRSPKQRRSPEHITEITELLSTQKAAYVAQGDEKNANEILIKETIFKIQNDYWDCFELLGEKKYYHSWCKLEQVEIAIKFLLNHYMPVEDEYSIKFIKEYIAKFQQLFPYKLFASSEIVKVEKYCSICGQKVSLRTSCGHIKGQIYMGEACHHNVTRAEVVGISMTTDPFNKYAVMGISPNGEGEIDDIYWYPSLEYLYSILDMPYDQWRSEEYKVFEPHNRYKESRNDKCPCGSGQKYKKCCLTKEGVEVDHTEIYLESPTRKSIESSSTLLPGKHRKFVTR